MNLYGVFPYKKRGNPYKRKMLIHFCQQKHEMMIPKTKKVYQILTQYTFYI